MEMAKLEWLAVGSVSADVALSSIMGWPGLLHMAASGSQRAVREPASTHKHISRSACVSCAIVLWAKESHRARPVRYLLNSA